MNDKIDFNVEIDLLWQKFLFGDDKSFDRLYEKYVRILFAYGLQFTNDRELVKDCIQDVFVQMLEMRTQLHHVKNAGVFLHISLKNRLLNALNREKLEIKYANYISTAEFSAVDGNTAEQELESLEEEQHNRNRVEAMMKLLTPQQKKVVHYRYMEDLSLDEISILLKISYQSVQNILQRAINKIKKHFSSEK